MEGKLIKRGHSYALKIDEKLVAFAHPEDFSNNNIMGELSLTNCQAIERGYDLDELADDECREIDAYRIWEHKIKSDPYFKIGYKKGFQKALEIIGDKKFTEEDMVREISSSWIKRGLLTDSNAFLFEYLNERIKSLQQTEWGVTIETEIANNQCDGCKSNHDVNDLNMHVYPNSTRVYMVCQKEKYKTPKLDKNGKLILKRK